MLVSGEWGWVELDGKNQISMLVQHLMCDGGHDWKRTRKPWAWRWVEAEEGIDTSQSGTDQEAHCLSSVCEMGAGAEVD